MERYHIRCQDSREEVGVYGVNGLTSARKRMSIVMRSPSGEFVLFAKGADMMMSTDCGVIIPEYAQEHLQAFAVDGLRTLVVGQKQLTRAEFEHYEKPWMLLSVISTIARIDSILWLRKWSEIRACRYYSD